MAEAPSPSRLLDYLPGVYREDPFLGEFLLAFEKILLGIDDNVAPASRPGLEQSIAGMAALFDPLQAPQEFLEWLAGWTAFTLRADLDDVAKQRRFIANISQLYRRRGTRQNLQELLSIFTVGLPSVEEADPDEMQLGDHSTIGEDTYLAGGPPHFFKVTVRLPRGPREVQDRQDKIARSLIELEKPAHTFYDLAIIYPSMQIFDSSTVGVDTLLGAATG